MVNSYNGKTFLGSKKKADYSAFKNSSFNFPESLLFMSVRPSAFLTTCSKVASSFFSILTCPASRLFCPSSRFFCPTSRLFCPSSRLFCPSSRFPTLCISSFCPSSTLPTLCISSFCPSSRLPTLCIILFVLLQSPLT